jgi:hypothetical protein
LGSGISGLWELPVAGEKPLPGIQNIAKVCDYSECTAERRERSAAAR